ncbi:MAG: heavy metal translocating P-type ATPase [Spirochaetales bacterium]|nr:heavy metal translocating P-type ATPase [Spirochaetales bacterium]
MSTDRVLYIDGLKCASCAGKIEKATGKLAGVESASLNFTRGTISVKSTHSAKNLVKMVQKVADSLEPGISISDKAASNVTEDRKNLLRIKNWITIAGSALFVVAIIIFGLVKVDFPYSNYLKLAIYLLAWGLVGYDIIFIAVRNIFKGRLFDENFLMTLATVGAFAIGEYPEAVAVMLFYRVGEYFQERAVAKSKSSIKSLLDLKAEFARVLGPGGSEVKIDAAKVKVGDLLLVKQGEKIPADGKVERGEAYIDTSSLTGESLPVFVKVGDEVSSGTLNSQGLLHVRASKEFENSTIARIMNLVEHASDKKSKAENFITKFARIYTPVVVVIAALLAFVPPLFAGQPLGDWVYRALIFLVVSCPCALVVSVPLSFFGGVGRASRSGILIKGANYLEAVNQADTIVMDKTGTLTKGVFAVEKVDAIDGEADRLLNEAFLLEKHSTHPIANAICNYFSANFKAENNEVNDFREIPGKGLSCVAVVNGSKSELMAGNMKFLQENGVANLPDAENSSSLAVYLARDKSYSGKILLSDGLKEGAAGIAAALKKAGFAHVAVLTGDKEPASKASLTATGIDEIHGDLLPQDKFDFLEKYKAGTAGKVIFVGDGINDAAVLAAADVGISMGAGGSDIAVEASNIVLMNDRLESIFTLKKIATKTRKIVIENIVLSLGVKVLFLGLGAFGLMNVWGAVFADVGVSLLAVLNSIRVLKGRI